MGKVANTCCCCVPLSTAVNIIGVLDLLFTVRSLYSVLNYYMFYQFETMVGFTLGFYSYVIILQLIFAQVPRSIFYIILTRNYQSYRNRDWYFKSRSFTYLISIVLFGWEIILKYIYLWPYLYWVTGYDLSRLIYLGISLGQIVIYSLFDINFSFAVYNYRELFDEELQVGTNKS